MKYCVVYLKDGTVLDFDKKGAVIGSVEPDQTKANTLMGIYTYKMTLIGVVPIENIRYVFIEGV